MAKSLSFAFNKRGSTNSLKLVNGPSNEAEHVEGPNESPEL